MIVQQQKGTQNVVFIPGLFGDFFGCVRVKNCGRDYVFFCLWCRYLYRRSGGVFCYVADDRLIGLLCLGGRLSLCFIPNRQTILFYEHYYGVGHTLPHLRV